MSQYQILFLLFFHLFYQTLFSQTYFQQEVNYSIDVKLDDKNHTLSAFETLQYVNNSPDTLSFIYMHIWPNAYKNDQTEMAKQLMEERNTRFYYAGNEDRGYIDSLDFKVENAAVKWGYDEKHLDICKLYLNTPLLPGKSITITTPFKVKIPKGIFSRLGHIGESYQITQWYPKPAVYDKNGWNQMPYLTQGEFYSEYGSFDVKITLPKNYVVGSTGDLVDGDEEIKWMRDQIKKTNSDSISRKAKLKSGLTSFPPSSDTFKTLHYKQDRVHDFAWFADKRWHILEGEVTLPHSGRRVKTWAMFTDAEAHLWEKSIEYLNDAIYYYSLWNGDYPYNQMTAVDGALSAGGGMEYPNVTVIGTSNSAIGLETVIMHETGHQWFYGVLGSNEREHPWMDEGINSFNENRYFETKYGDSLGVLGMKQNHGVYKWFDLNRPHKDQYYLGYIYSARTNGDQPIELHSTKYSPINYGTIVYMKTALAFDYLKGYLGEPVFDKAMQRYFNEWKFKHPQPEDLEKIIEEESGQNLGWFFDQLLVTTRKIDYKIANIKSENNGYTLKVKNKGKIASPFSISGLKNDSIIETKWFKGFYGTTDIAFPFGDFEKIKLDAIQDVPDINRSNSTLKIKSVLKKVEPFRLQLFGSAENPDKTQLFLLPTVGWNNYNQWMTGLAFYNSRLPENKIEYLILPMYAFGTKNLTGNASLFFNTHPNNTSFHTIRLGTKLSSYSFERSSKHSRFVKIAPEINLDFNKANPRGLLHHGIDIHLNTIIEDFAAVQELNNYNDITYRLKYDHPLNPMKVKVKIQQGEMYSKVNGSFVNVGNQNFLKASLEYIQRFEYNSQHKAIDVRVFAGKFLINNTNHPRYNWRMDGTSGVSGAGALLDYTYDNIFLGRTEQSGVLSQQFVANQGGFKTKTSAGQSNDWIASMNLDVDLPGNFPIAVFSDLGYNSYGDFLLDAGIHLWIKKGIFDVYFPLAFSDKITAVNGFDELKDREKIRFTLNLHLTNPFEAIRNFEF